MNEAANSPLEHFHRLFTQQQYPNLHREFQSGSVRRNYTPGETIVYQEENINKLGYLYSGEAEIEILSEEGEMLLAEKFNAGSLLNSVSYIDGQTSPATVVAATECTVLFIPYSSLKKSPELDTEATQLAGLCAASLYRMAEQLLSTSLLLPLKERLLLRLEKLQGEKEEVAITAEKLASYLAVSKHRVHRMLNELEKENRLINRYGSVKLLDR